MKKLILLLLLVTTPGFSQTVTYTANNTNFPNPERGLLKYTKTNSIGTYSFLSQSSLSTMRTSENMTLILRIYDLGAFKTTPISQTFLNNIQTDFNTLRTSGVKCVLRFRYSETDNIDATKSVLLNHINQLKPITIVNQDVIHVVEAGFIGQYGEWYYTSNYGNAGVISTQNLADRKEIGLKIMELAPSRLIMFRTPKFQTLVGGSTPISSTTAYSGTTNSRIGLHNDAFLSSNSDMGTFSNTKTEYPYLDTQSKYTFCGGESAALFPTKQNCSVVFGWLARFHYNYLNSGYHPDVLSLWKTNGCYDEIVRRLGYRFELVNSNITNGVLTINIKNVGFANVFNQRDVYVVLKNTTNGTVYSFKLNTDIRLWNAGATATIIENLSTRVIPIGTYDIFLNAPDKTVSNSKYSIQFANGNIYDGVTGYNKLNQTFTSKLARLSSTVNYKIFVYDLTGKLISNNTEDLKKGLYIVKMVDEKTNNVHIQKLYKN